MSEIVERLRDLATPSEGGFVTLKLDVEILKQAADRIAELEAAQVVCVVERRGIYGRGIYGTYGSRDLAEAAIVRAKDKERDDYHAFVIIPMQLNKDAVVDGGFLHYSGEYSHDIPLPTPPEESE